eukprot:15474202-Alexandrium_andersonii.AAC.1
MALSLPRHVIAFGHVPVASGAVAAVIPSDDIRCGCVTSLMSFLRVVVQACSAMEIDVDTGRRSRGRAALVSSSALCGATGA